MEISKFAKISEIVAKKKFSPTEKCSKNSEDLVGAFINTATYSQRFLGDQTVVAQGEASFAKARR